MFEPPAERGPLAGRIFQEHAGLDARGLAMDRIECLDHTLDSLVLRALGKRARMRDDVRDAQFVGAEQFDSNCLDRHVPKRRLRTGQIDQVGIMGDRKANT